MPFRAMTQDGVLTSADLEVLQEIYESAATSLDNIDENEKHAAVHLLLMRYRAGERDREKLIGLARQVLSRTVG